MSKEEFDSNAYQAGSAAAVSSRLDNHVNMDNYPNPYEYNSQDWQLWNLGWNHELQQNG